jgi:DNA (cytosine-5)-methyltransferase 1
MSRSATIVDLFSGCGGLSYGLHLAADSLGINARTVAAFDNWQVSCDTYERNIGVKPTCASLEIDNLTQLLDGIGSVDLVVGGPPCQGFSTSGKRALDDPRNQLVWSFLKVVEMLQPKAFLMENVSGFASFAEGRLLSEVKEFANSLGYHTRAGILQASMHGVPQRRKRFTLVGSLKPGFLFPGEQAEVEALIPTFGLDYEQKIDPALEISFASAVSDLPYILAGESSDSYKSGPSNNYQKLMRKGNPPLTMHTAVGHGEKMLDLMRYIPEGKSAFDPGVFATIPEELRPRGGFKNSYARLRADAPAPTITRNFTTPSSANCIHPFQDRALSLREGARAQSFPDSFRFSGTTEEIRLQIGNAVPPLLASSVGVCLLNHLDL